MNGGGDGLIVFVVDSSGNANKLTIGGTAPPSFKLFVISSSSHFTSGTVSRLTARAVCGRLHSSFGNTCLAGKESGSGIIGSNGKPIIVKRKLNPPSVTRDKRELVETILSTLRRGGNVLLPVDASGRVLGYYY